MYLSMYVDIINIAGGSCLKLFNHVSKMKAAYVSLKVFIKLSELQNWKIA